MHSLVFGQVENGVSMCFTCHCDFVVSDATDGLCIHSFTQHTMDKHVHHIMAVCGLTWDDRQSGMHYSQSKSGVSIFSIHPLQVPVHTI